MLRIFGGDARLRRLTAFFVIAAAASVAILSDSRLSAQEEEPPAAAEENPAPVGDPGEAESAGGSEESLLGYFVGALGVKYSIGFLFLSFTFVALLVMNIVAAQRSNMAPLGLIEGFEEHLNEKRYQEAYDLARSDESFLGRVLAEGLARLSSGYPQAIEAMQETGEEENMKLEHRLSYISLIGAVSPMVGLLGTVDGMVRAFGTIKRHGQTPNPQELAGDISTALITTLVGLSLAIPAIVAASILRNRIQRLSLEVGVVSERLMSRFENVSPKKPA